MVHVNANLELEASLNIDTQILNDLLRNINGNRENLYITFYARKEEFKSQVAKDKKDSFLSVILPYEEIINADDALPILLTQLAQNVNRLKWLDHVTLKEKIEEVLDAQSTPEALSKRLERAVKWKADRLVQINHLNRVLKEGSNISVYHKEPEDYPDIPWEEEE